MIVRRFDIGRLGAVERMENGWLRAPGRLTRTGIFLYRDADGNTRRELRLPEEVFHPEALRSFAMVPMTVEHPPVMLDAQNTKEYAVGHLGENVVPDGDHVSATIMLTDAKGIVAAEGGKQELSCGYTCRLDMTPGVWRGMAYDCIQRGIRGNHVSLVDRGRAGPTARLQLDKFDAVQVDAPDERSDMKKFLIGGVWHEVSELVAQALEVEAGQHKGRLDALTQENAKLKSDADKQKAKLDTLEEDLAKEKQARVDAESPAKIATRIKERLELEKVAQKVLPAGTKLDSLSDKDIKAKVVQAKYPTAKLDGVSADYLQARFDTVVEKLPETTTDPSTTTPRHLDSTSTTEARADAAPQNPEATRQKTLKEENQRWRQPLKG